MWVAEWMEHVPGGRPASRSEISDEDGSILPSPIYRPFLPLTSRLRAPNIGTAQGSRIWGVPDDQSNRLTL